MIFWILCILLARVYGFGFEKDTAISRRNIIFGTANVFGLVSFANHAEASYSAYAERERDWEDRNKKGGKQKRKRQS